MKRFSLLTALAVAPLTAASGAPARAAASKTANAATAKQSSVATPAAYPYKLTKPSALKIKPYQFNPPEPRREVLPNGLVIYIMEDHQLPIFHISAYVKAGSLYDSADKIGLAGLAASTIRTGGAGAKTGDEIDQALDYVGASLAVGLQSGSQEYAAASGQSLIKDSDLVIGELADMLQHPTFDASKLELARGQLLEGIRRQNDDPSTIAFREFKRIVYGKTNPWAFTPTFATAKSIARQDLIDFHAKYYRPNATIMAVAGDFKTDDMLAKLRSAFGGWENADIDYPAIPPLKDVEKRDVYVIDKDAPQTSIWMGHLGYRRHNPDQPAIEVMNQILGQGAFTSRLMMEVRSNQGLAYSVWGGVFPGTDRGFFYAEAESKTESAVKAAQLMDKIIAGMRTHPATEAEVKSAKEQILNSFVFNFTSPFQIVDQRAIYETKGYPADYLKTYPEKIRKIAPADVKAAALKYLHPDQMAFLLVGKTEGSNPPVSSLGPVTKIALENPGDDASQTK